MNETIQIKQLMSSPLETNVPLQANIEKQSVSQILTNCLEQHKQKFKTLIKHFAEIDNKNVYNQTEKTRTKYSELIKEQIKLSYNDTIVDSENENNNIKTNDKYFINATKVFDNDINIPNSKNVCIPFDMINIFNFAYPLLIPNFEIINNTSINISQIQPLKKIYKFYEMIDVNDEIFIYQTISRDSIIGIKYNNTHLSVLIKTKSGYIFSFGLIGGTGKEDIIKKGLFDFTSIKNAKIITPDKFLEYKLNYEITNNDEPGNFVKLIAKTQIKRSHIDKIKAIFENIANEINIESLKTDLNLELYLDYFDPSIFNESGNNIKKNHEIYDILTNLNEMIIKKTDQETYNNTVKLFKGNNDSRKYYLSPCFEYNYKLNDYCSFSRHTKQTNTTLKQTSNNKKTKKTHNCSSFIQELFNDIIKCSGSSIASLSQYCSQKSTIISEPCK